MDKNISDRASRLRMSSLSLATSMRGGNFRSVSRGQGIEFSDVREYLPGDNVRSIDWNVTARMGRAFIKQYEEDRELNVFVILDCSLSMLSGFRKKTKLEAASEISALLILASEHNSGANGAVFFDGEIEFSCPPKSGRENAMMILSKLNNLAYSTAKAGSALPNAIRGAASLLKKRSLVFVISDFRIDGYQNEIAVLAQKNDVVAVRITTPSDSELPKVGTLPFSDPETGKSLQLPTSSEQFSKAWFDANRYNTDLWYENCLKRGISPLCISTAEDPVLALNKFFALRKK